MSRNLDIWRVHPLHSRYLFYKLSIISTIFSPFWETLYAGHIRLFAEVLELFMHTSFSLSAKWRHWNASFRGPKRWKLGVCWMRTVGRIRRTVHFIVAIGSIVRILVYDVAFSRRRTWFIFVFGEILHIRCFNWFDVWRIAVNCLWRHPRIPLTIPSLSQKTLAFTLPGEVHFDFFLA